MKKINLMLTVERIRSPKGIGVCIWWYVPDGHGMFGRNADGGVCNNSTRESLSVLCALIDDMLNDGRDGATAAASVEDIAAAIPIEEISAPPATEGEA